MRLKNIDKLAQVSLEIAISLACVFILLMASARLFIWLNERMAQRQERYESTRVLAGGTPLPLQVQVDEFTGAIKFSAPPFPLTVPFFANEIHNKANEVNEALTFSSPLGGFADLDILGKRGSN